MQDPNEAPPPLSPRSSELNERVHRFMNKGSDLNEKLLKFMKDLSERASNVEVNVYPSDEEDTVPPLNIEETKRTFRSIGEVWSVAKGPNAIPPVFVIRHPSDIRQILELGDVGILMLGEIARGYIGENKAKKIDMPEIQ